MFREVAAVQDRRPSGGWTGQVRLAFPVPGSEGQELLLNPDFKNRYFIMGAERFFAVGGRREEDAPWGALFSETRFLVNSLKLVAESCI